MLGCWFCNCWSNKNLFRLSGSRLPLFEFGSCRLDGLTESMGNLSTVYAHKDWSVNENALLLSEDGTFVLKGKTDRFPFLWMYLEVDDLTEDGAGVPENGESVW